jgi:hypothetical protein
MEKTISSIQQHNGVAGRMNEPSMNDLEAWDFILVYLKSCRLK